MPGTKEPNAPVFPMTEVGAKTLDALSALAEANQRVAGRLIELSSSAAADRLRTLGELQSAAVEATRDALGLMDPVETFDDFRKDPIAWYRQSVLFTIASGQRMFKLLETSAQIASRDAQRLQGSAESAGKEIRDAVSACVGQLRGLSGARS